MLDVTVVRSKWGNAATNGSGLHAHKSQLFNPASGLMCCLGFACIAAGLTRKQISDVGGPATLIRNKSIQLPSELDKLINASLVSDAVENSTVCRSLMIANDSSNMLPEERESTIAALGKDAGINFTFVD